MNEKKSGISRRQFARRAALLSASASLAPATVFGEAVPTAPAQGTPGEPKLSPESQAEADARYQQILNQYGRRLSADDQAIVKQANATLQESLDHMRAFPLENGNGPALYLKPLVEREKKKQEAPAAPAKKS